LSPSTVVVGLRVAANAARCRGSAPNVTEV
jgi:hypothetical protein